MTFTFIWDSLVAQTVKEFAYNGGSLGWGDPLKEEGSGIPFQYSCLENPMKEEPGGRQSVGSRRVGHN